MLITFQDFLEADDRTRFVSSAIQSYKQSDVYQTAVLADEYDAQRNPTIVKAIKTLYTVSGSKVEDPTASNSRIACNIYSRLNTQRCMYSLGNGISFIDPYEAAAGKKDTTKERLGRDFDHRITQAAYDALKHGVTNLFWNREQVYEFKATEFVPLLDETTGALMAGIRFWQIDQSKPLNAVLYEADGYTKYSNADGEFRETQAKTAYNVTYTYTDAGDVISIDEDNYTSLPIVRMYASRLRQSTLIGLKEAIDAYDLIQSGFANDLTDCAQVYWIVENYGGMTDIDLAQFLDRLKLNHVANADTQSGGKVTPYTQDVPFQARKAFLDDIRARMYEDFGVLDVHTVSAGATNDHIDMAYQSMDDNAADFEHWIGDAIVQLLRLQGIDDVPLFNRNRISNQSQQVEMLVQEAAWLDSTTIIRKLPNLTPDEKQAAIDASQEEDVLRAGFGAQQEAVTENEGE